MKFFWHAGMAALVIGPMWGNAATVTLKDRDVGVVTVATMAGTSVSAECVLQGKPWENYSRGLIRFNLDGLSRQAATHEKVGRAVLRLTVDTQDNAQARPLDVGAVTVPWTRDATWATTDGKTPWPSLNQFANIDYALDPQTVVATVVAKHQTVEVDLTAIVDAWLYQGRPNHGLLLRIGETIFGRPNAGAWNVKVSEMTLTVEMTGRPPTPAAQPARTLRYYPSALLPPVRSPYYFHMFNGAPTEHSQRLINSFDATGARPEQGELALTWFYGPNNPYLNTAQEFVESYSKAAMAGGLGIHVDEWQGATRSGVAVGEGEDPNRLKDEEKLTGSIDGILAAKKLNPAFFIAVYWRGEDSILPLTQHGLPDLLIVEAQEYLHHQFPLNIGITQQGVLKRLAYAKKLGMIERTIPLIGMFETVENYHPGKVLTLAQVDQWIKIYRQQYPEMPGIAFYGGKGDELLRQTEALCWNYYVAPAPDVKLEKPAFGAMLRHPRVECRANATGKDGRAIQRYDWLVDNRLVAQTPDAVWVWDTRDTEPGNHLITVQVIDSAWNRSAVQLPVQVIRNAR
jgi:hypothetical protein